MPLMKMKWRCSLSLLSMLAAAATDASLWAHQGRYMNYEFHGHGRITTSEVHLRRKYHELRKAYGKLYCQTHDVGPTGGFCLKEGKPVGSNEAMDAGLCACLAELFRNQSVLDLGCGWGQYGTCLQGQNAGISWLGFDGSEGIEELTGGKVGWMDLAESVWLGKMFDWVMSVEVAEHVPVQYEDVFLDNMVRHATKGIVLTWAVPGQGGHFHVNCRSNEYAIAAMQARGFKFDNHTSVAFRQKVSSLPWLRDTLMVFRRGL